jgi:hypothetical protein
LNETIARVVAMTPPEQEVAEALFSASELIVTQMALIQDYNRAATPEVQAVTFFTRDFPTSYVRALDELIHPPCFAACFVTDPRTRRCGRLPFFASMPHARRCYSISFGHFGSHITTTRV